MGPQTTAVVEVLKYRDQLSHGWMEDQLAVEEPLEIRLEYGQPQDRQAMSLAITMRTPGHDRELALGFLLTEGVISQADEVVEAYGCGPKQAETGTQNIVKVILRSDVAVNAKLLTRHVYTTSSCGICGKASLDAVRSESRFEAQLRASEGWLETRVLEALPERLRQLQATFAATGGLHAAALFTAAGEAVAAFEDVGRHNALDKLIGYALEKGAIPPQRQILLVSGRASFELVQKAAMAGIPALAAIGAPSSLAVALAHEFGMALIGFLKPGRLNLYAGAAHLREA